MANRFWVGGTGNWNDTAHWSTTSGGGGGSAVPTSSDAVKFDANSGTAATVTVNVAAVADTLVVNKSDLTLLLANTLTVNSGGFGPGLHGTEFTAGTINTAGFACQFGQFVIDGNSTTLTLGASAVAVDFWDSSAASGLTVTANTATVTMISTSAPSFTGGSATMSGLSVSFAPTDAAGATVVSAIGLKNLSFVAAGTGDLLRFSANVTLTGNFRVVGVSAANRVVIQGGSVVGLPAGGYTITAATATIANVDFQNITGAGAAAPFSGTAAAIGVPTSRLNTAPSSTTTTVVSPTSTIGANTTAFLLATTGAVLKTIASITDSKGNIWTVDRGAQDPGTSRTANIASARIVAALTTSDTITITWNQATTASVRIIIYEVGGFWKVKDAAATGDDGGAGSNHLLIGPTAALVTAAEIAWCVFNFNLTAPVVTPNNGWALGSVQGANGRNMYLVTPSAAAVTADASIDVSPRWGGIVVSYQTAAVGDRGGNSGITFTPAAAQAWQGTAGGNWSDASKWTSRVPLPQDDVTIPNAFSAGQTISVDVIATCRNLDFTGMTGAVTIGPGGSTEIYAFGSVTFAASLVWNASMNLHLSAWSGTKTFGSAGVVFAGGMNIDAPGGTYQLAADYADSGSGSTLAHRAGTFDANGHNVTIRSYTSSSANAHAVVFGSGTWTLTGLGTVWAPQAADTITPGAGLIDITDSSATGKTFAGQGKSYPALRYISAGAGALTITGSNTFAGLNVTCSTARTLTLPAGGTQTINGTLVLQGSSGQLLTVVSSTGGVATTLYVNGSYTPGTFTSISADVKIEPIQVTATITGSSSVTCTVVRTRARTAAATGASTVTAAITKATRITAAATGSSTVSATIGLPPVNTVTPSAFGIATAGRVVSVTNGTWRNTPTSFSYQWQRSPPPGSAWTNIAGETATTYLIPGADFGHFLRCVVTATNAFG